MTQRSALTSTIKAIIGLGNPGAAYFNTRHNIGFRVVDALAERHGGEWKSRDEMAYTEITVGENKITLIKPQTYMNNSGRVIPFLIKKGIKPEEILVIQDELDLPFGKVALKQGGSARGHNGVKSIIAAMGDAFPRIRCGVGRPESLEAVDAYVLASFSQSKEEVQQLIDKAVADAEKLI